MLGSAALDRSRLEALRVAALDSTYVSLGGRRTASVHEFYRYPARFSPQFARAAIEAFTSANDLVVDPFSGGGTSVVEAQRLGRRSIGADINSLATFVTRAKTTLYCDCALDEVLTLASAVPELPLAVGEALRNPWAGEGYWRNISCPETWRIRNLMASGIDAVSRLGGSDARVFGRCALLRTGQWALDMREVVPSVADFRHQLRRDLESMVDVARAYREEILAVRPHHEPTILELGLPGAAKHAAMLTAGEPALILTSPPYPGVYVNYHRWKVRGRRETPAPYWVAGRQDGHGISHYTMSARNRDSSRKYFDKLRAAYEGLVGLMMDSTWLVQMVGFNEGRPQFEQYLELMKDLGLEEVLIPHLETDGDGRLWRSVPGRRWWVAAGDLASAAQSTSREVVLIHRRAT